MRQCAATRSWHCHHSRQRRRCCGGSAFTASVWPVGWRLYALSFSPACLVLDGLDPTDAAVSEDRTAVVTTMTNVVVAKDNSQVSALAAEYSPQCVSRHPSKPEYAVGGKVSGWGRGGAGVGLWMAGDLSDDPPPRTARSTSYLSVGQS